MDTVKDIGFLISYLNAWNEMKLTLLVEYLFKGNRIIKW